MRLLPRPSRIPESPPKHFSLSSYPRSPHPVRAMTVYFGSLISLFLVTGTFQRGMSWCLNTNTPLNRVFIDSRDRIQLAPRCRHSVCAFGRAVAKCISAWVSLLLRASYLFRARSDRTRPYTPIFSFSHLLVQRLNFFSFLFVIVRHHAISRGHLENLVNLQKPKETESQDEVPLIGFLQLEALRTLGEKDPLLTQLR